MNYPLRVVAAIGLLLGVGTALVIAFAPSSWRTSISVYTTLMAVVAAVLLMVALADRERPFSKASVREVITPHGGSEAAELADRVQLAVDSAYDFHYRLMPLLYELASAYSHAGPRGTLDDALWDRIRPTGSPPPGARGPTPAELSSIIQAIDGLRRGQA